MKSKRHAFLDPIDNIPLLQEIACIKNYEAIKSSLDEKKKLEDEFIKFLEVTVYFKLLNQFIKNNIF